MKTEQEMTLKDTRASKLALGLSITCICLTALIFLLFVDMRPRISPDFFFGSDDPEIADTQKIKQLFPADEFLILSVGSQNIHSWQYMGTLRQLTDKLALVPGISRLISVSNGPGSMQTAAESPFWRPLLIDVDESATLIIVFLERDVGSTLIGSVEATIEPFRDGRGVSKIHLSGMPFIAEQIKRSLVRDTKLFSTAALVVFAVLLWGLYRAPMIALGASLSGVSAIFLTLTILHFLQQPIGILTANLATIVFVLVQSQVIYLSNNWLRETGQSIRKIVRQAVKKTIIPSIWCAVTTFLGFLSLVFVSAEPLRQLGVGGMIGVLCAFACCYLIFPPFLTFAVRRKTTGRNDKAHSIMGSRSVQLVGGVVLVGAFVSCLPGIWNLNTDPGLFSYFKKGGEIQAGLAVIDENGGSSPLQLIVSDKSGGQLDNEGAYQRLWNLHADLAEHREVGTVLSLPALLAEANKHPLAFLLPWREIVSLLSLEANQSVVDNFLTSDRRQSLFLLRMKEDGRTELRTEVIGEIEKLAGRHGFRIDLTGGVYALQGRMSVLIKNSVTVGIASLLILFAVISFVITRNIRLSVAMFATATLVPVISVGAIGHFAIPLDVISAPAASVALGLAVDALIHLALAVKRKRQNAGGRDIWQAAIKEQGTGILASSGIIFLGFLIFSFSDFPPTTRFGVMVIAGAMLAGVGALTFFPLASRLVAKRVQN